jgi:hypothetical protein
MIGKGNRSTRRKPAPVPLCPPQTPHATWTRTRAAAVGSQRLTAWTTARLSSCTLSRDFFMIPLFTQWRIPLLKLQDCNTFRNVLCSQYTCFFLFCEESIECFPRSFQICFSPLVTVSVIPMTTGMTKHSYSAFSDFNALKSIQLNFFQYLLYNVPPLRYNNN